MSLLILSVNFQALAYAKSPASRKDAVESDAYTRTDVLNGDLEETFRSYKLTIIIVFLLYMTILVNILTT